MKFYYIYPEFSRYNPYAAEIYADSEEEAIETWLRDNEEEELPEGFEIWKA